MTIQEIKNRIYQGFVSSFNNAITPLRYSFFDQLSNALAAAFQLLYIYYNNIFKDSFLSTCTESRVLNYFAPLKNVVRKDATQSIGVGRFTGTDGATIPAGTKMTYNELEYETIDEGAIASGYVDINCQSVGAGSENNTLANIELFLIVPISGVDNKVVSTAGFATAIDQETVESVRTRTKQKFAAPTSVDNDFTYKSLANEVPNVRASFISSLKNGVGTFGVTIFTQGNDGVPVQADIDAVEQYFIDNEAIPEYVEAEFFLPVITPVDFTIILATDTDDNRADMEQAIQDYLDLNQKPNTIFVYQGLADYIQKRGGRMNSPLPTVTTTLDPDEILSVGTITWT